MFQKSSMCVGRLFRTSLALILVFSLWICQWPLPVFSEGETPPAEPNDLTPNITNVLWEVCPQYESAYRPIDTTQPIEIKAEDQYRLTINYILPVSTLSTEQAQCIYQLPAQFDITQQMNGTISNNNETVGEYVIEPGGKVTLTFYGRLINENADSPVYGDLMFWIEGSQIDTSQGQKIKFSDSNEFSVTPPQTEPDPENGWISIDKEGAKTEGLKINYKITVSALDDTTGGITVTDTLKNGTAEYLDNTLKIVKSDGTLVSPNKITWHDKSFVLELPGLKKDESYTITYEMEAAQAENNGTNSIQNYAEAQTGSQTSGSWGPTLSYTHTMLGKEGKQIDPDHIQWTIVVNEAMDNLNGWTLRDEFNDTDFDEEVHISPAIDGRDTIKLPYKFTNDDNTTYTITYTTPADVMINQQSVKNKAVLEKGNEVIEQEDTVYIPDSGDYDPLKKTGDWIIQTDQNKAEAQWTVTFDLSHGSLAEGWTYTDTLRSDTYFTKEQKTQLEQAVMDAFRLKAEDIKRNEDKKANGFTSDVLDLEWKEENEKIKGFVLTGHQKIEMGTKISFTYWSTADIDSGTISNAGTLRDRGHPAEDSAELTLLPLLEKIDPEFPGSTWSTHDRRDLTDDTLTWHVRINIPNGMKDALTVVDTLPAGTNFKKADLQKDGEAIESAAITQHNNEITCVLDQDLVKRYGGDTLTLVVQATLNEEKITWRDDENQDKKTRQAHFENTASAFMNNVKIKQASQSQTVTESKVKNRIDKTDPLLAGKKTEHAFYSLENGQIKWRISQYIEPDQAKALIVEDDFPDELKFVRTSISQGSNDLSQRIDTDQSNGKLRWILNEELIKENQGKTIVFDVSFAIPEDYVWNPDANNIKTSTTVFENKCRVLEENTELDHDAQTQTIIKDLTKNVLKKNGSYDEQSGILTYSVSINPEGRTLNGTEGTYHLHDQLKYRFKGDQYDSYRVLFMPEKTILYEIDTEGRKTEVAEKDWILQYAVRTDPNDKGMQRIDIEADVPDGKALELVYSYQVSGRQTANQSISNTVDLLINDGSYAHSGDSVEAQSTKHSASAGTHSVTINKADEENIHRLLANAEFDLYKYDKNQKTYTRINTEPIRTDAQGKKVINIEFDTAYYLQETKAPDGYLLDDTKFYFYVIGSDTSNDPNMPEGFETDEQTHTYMNNSNVFITNKPNTTSLTIEKKWVDQAGIALQGPKREVKCNLIQYTDDEPLEQEYTYSLDIQQSSQSIWKAENAKVKKGTKLKVTVDALSKPDFADTLVEGWKKYDPAETEELDDFENGNRYSRYTYIITIDRPNSIFQLSNYRMKNPHVEIIEPELDGTIIQRNIVLNNQNDYKMVIDHLKTEEWVNGKKVYYAYDVEELPMAGYIASYEKETIDSGEKIVITNHKTDTGGFEFPETGTNNKQIIKYVGGVMTFGLICASIDALKNRRKGKS